MQWGEIVSEGSFLFHSPALLIIFLRIIFFAKIVKKNLVKRQGHKNKNTPSETIFNPLWAI